MDRYFECAAKLNNAAVVALLYGKRRRALELFKNAFNVLTHQDEEMDPAVNEDLSFPDWIYDITLPFIPVPAACVASPHDTNSKGFTYSKAFLFNPLLEFDPAWSASARGLILCNLALIYQKVSESTHDQYENTALSLYDKALELFERDNLDDLDFVYIAAKNNKVQIHVARADDPHDIRKLLDKLGVVIRHHMKKNLACFDDKDVNGFLLNVTCQGALVCAPGA